MDDRALEVDLGREPLFDPDAGVTIAAPEGRGPGNWAGAPGAVVADGVVYLAYRLRAPSPRRGYALVVARSADGVRFETVRRVAREDLGALSIERCAIARLEDGWRLFVSFVAIEDRRWRIEAIDGDAIERLNVRSRRPALLPDRIGVAGVKDPWLRRVDGAWRMFVSFGELPGGAGPDLHTTGDALSTGRTRSLTGLATSPDALTWQWHGTVLEPSEGRWDAYTSRLTTAIPADGGWIGFYDGSTLEGNYEERCGLAFSDDLRRWRKAAADAPALGTASGPGGVRYLDVCPSPGGVLRAYYEYTRPDGSHELRTAALRPLARDVH